MTGLTYHITTLGCRVNHAESREMESVLRDRGLVPAADRRSADLVVVHTCTVTRAAAAKSRQAVRRTARGRPRPPHVLVTGCYTFTNASEASSLAGGDDHIIEHHAEDGSSLIGRFIERLDAWLAAQSATPSRNHDGPRLPLLRPIRPNSKESSPKGRDRGLLPLPVVRPHRSAGRHVRAELRIQDGCDAHCTFCIIPSIRRTLRSKRIDDAVYEAHRLVELGHREIVLTGIFIGAYGHETALRRKQSNRHTSPLADLVDAVAQVPGLERLRISSMEPGDVNETLLDAMLANAPIVVPHLHLPLQSGSDAVLKRMNRQYRVGDYLEMIDMVNEALTVDDLPPAITTDIICGFPGETDHDFQQTIAVAERVGYLHMHVFPYSPREGTAAARWTSRFVPEHLTRQRVRTLIDLENDPVDGLSIRYRSRLDRRTVRVIIEQPDRDDPSLMTGRCDHYALVHLRTDRPRGSLVHATVTGVQPHRTTAHEHQTRIALPVAG